MPDENTAAPTTADLIEEIFHCIGPDGTHAQELTGAFLRHATDVGLRLGTSAAVPPSGTCPDGPFWEREGTPLTQVIEGEVVTVTVNELGPDPAMTPKQAKLHGRHLIEAGTVAERQAAALAAEEKRATAAQRAEEVAES